VRRSCTTVFRRLRSLSSAAWAALLCVAAFAGAAGPGGAGKRACHRAISACAQQGRQLAKATCNGPSKAACRRRVLPEVQGDLPRLPYECQSCCDDGGNASDARCGDGVVTAARGEQCDPPGSPAGEAVCVMRAAGVPRLPVQSLPALVSSRQYPPAPPEGRLEESTSFKFDGAHSQRGRPACQAAELQLGRRCRITARGGLCEAGIDTIQKTGRNLTSPPVGH
jgi:hypothetical protein